MSPSSTERILVRISLINGTWKLLDECERQFSLPTLLQPHQQVKSEVKLIVPYCYQGHNYNIIDTVEDNKISTIEPIKILDKKLPVKKRPNRKVMDILRRYDITSELCTNLMNNFKLEVTSDYKLKRLEKIERFCVASPLGDDSDVSETEKMYQSPTKFASTFKYETLQYNLRYNSIVLEKCKPLLLRLVKLTTLDIRRIQNELKNCSNNENTKFTKNILKNDKQLRSNCSTEIQNIFDNDTSLILCSSDEDEDFTNKVLSLTENKCDSILLCPSDEEDDFTIEVLSSSTEQTIIDQFEESLCDLP